MSEMEVGDKHNPMIDTHVRLDIKQRQRAEAHVAAEKPQPNDYGRESGGEKNDEGSFGVAEERSRRCQVALLKGIVSDCLVLRSCS